MSEVRLVHVILNCSKSSEHLANQLQKTCHLPGFTFKSASKIDPSDNPEIVLGDPNLLVDAEEIPKSLKWFHSRTTGADGYAKALIARNATHFKITRNAIGRRLIGEYVLAQVLNFERNFFEARRLQLNREWGYKNQEHENYRVGSVCNYRILQGRKCAILGQGDIGNEISRMLDVALDVKTVASLVRQPREGSMTHYTNLDTLLDEHGSGLDYLINVLPSTNQTQRILTEERVAKLNNCVFVNVGRGDVIDENLLVDSLNGNHLSGAILDVFEKEPLPENSRLWKHAKVILTPHVSARERALPEDSGIGALFCKNLERFCNGEDLLFSIDLDLGY